MQITGMVDLRHVFSTDRAVCNYDKSASNLEKKNNELCLAHLEYCVTNQWNVKCCDDPRLKIISAATWNRLSKVRSMTE